MASLSAKPAFLEGDRRPYDWIGGDLASSVSILSGRSDAA